MSDNIMIVIVLILMIPGLLVLKRIFEGHDKKNAEMYSKDKSLNKDERSD